MNPKHALQNIAFFMVGAVFMVMYVFFPQAGYYWNTSVNRLSALSTNSWNASVNSLKNLSFPTFGLGGDDEIKLAEVAGEAKPKITKDCGVSVTADLNKSSTYENNAVLNCLGDSARLCDPARGVLNDSFFPTRFEIVAVENGCNFKLSYPADSKLTDIDGKKLANQYIMCPVGIVRRIEESGSSAPVFREPSRDNADKYAAEIYSYGTIGLFIENNLDKNKIKESGCSGSYIDSLIKSYQEAESGA